MSAEVAAAIALASLLAEIVKLVAEGLLSPECEDRLCEAHPQLRPLLPRRPLSDYRDARTASMVARGHDPAGEIAATRNRVRDPGTALPPRAHEEDLETPAQRAEGTADYEAALVEDDPTPEDDGGPGMVA